MTLIIVLCFYRFVDDVSSADVSTKFRLETTAHAYSGRPLQFQSTYVNLNKKETIEIKYTRKTNK